MGLDRKFVVVDHVGADQFGSPIECGFYKPKNDRQAKQMLLRIPYGSNGTSRTFDYSAELALKLFKHELEPDKYTELTRNAEGYMIKMPTIEVSFRVSNDDVEILGKLNAPYLNGTSRGQ